jgi:hypothetical protein
MGEVIGGSGCGLILTSPGKVPRDLVGHIDQFLVGRHLCA